jgi:ubiquinone/menaquinone biosynthesis C-methylase UbiE
MVSREASDLEFLHELYAKHPEFRSYQYALVALHQSVYNNRYLRYRHYERAQTLLRLTTPKTTILDAGCGFGDLILELSNNDRNLVGVDIEFDKLRVAQARTARLGQSAEFVCADIHNLPFRDDAFNAAYSNQVIEHVGDPARIVREKLRVSESLAIVMCANSPSLPGTGFLYYPVLGRREKEVVPNLGGYDEIFYLNYLAPPLDSVISVQIARFVGMLPILGKVMAQNCAKVYRKKQSVSSHRLQN